MTHSDARQNAIACGARPRIFVGFAEMRAMDAWFLRVDGRRSRRGSTPAKYAAAIKAVATVKRNHPRPKRYFRRGEFPATYPLVLIRAFNAELRAIGCEEIAYTAGLNFQALHRDGAATSNGAAEPA